MEKKTIIKNLHALTDEKLIEIFQKHHGAKDEYSVQRKPNGSIFISWANDNGFRETASGLRQIYSSKLEQIDINFVPYCLTPTK